MSISTLGKTKAAVKKHVPCSDCAASHLCIFKDSSAISESGILDPMIEEELFLEKGCVVCDSGRPVRDIYAVRAGTLKECTIDRAGKERVIDFYFPGEIVGLDALSQRTYYYSILSIEKSAVCRIPFDSLLERIKHAPRLQHHILDSMSRQLFNRSLLNHFQSAEQQLAAFLLALSQRFAQLGRSGISYRLSMSRHEIAGYLQLTTETVSRVFTRFKRQALITVDKKRVVIRKPLELARLAA